MLNKYGIGLEEVRARAERGQRQYSQGAVCRTICRLVELGANDQIFKATQYQSLIVAYRNGTPVRVSDVGNVVDSVEDLRNAGYSNGKPSRAGDHLSASRAPTSSTRWIAFAAPPAVKAAIPQSIDLVGDAWTRR